MPKNQRGWIVRRIHQANEHIMVAQQQLASVLASLVAEHPELRPELLVILQDLNGARGKLREFAMPVFTRTAHDLHKVGQLYTILANAKPLPSPSYKSQTWEHQRHQPSRTPEHQKQLYEARKARLKQPHEA